MVNLVEGKWSSLSRVPKAVGQRLTGEKEKEKETKKIMT